MLAPWLDRELAAGIDPSTSGAHAARAEQLTCQRVRNAVARSLEQLVASARRSRSPGFAPTIPPCREQIRQAEPMILTTAARLRSEEPLAPRTVAGLKLLTGDRSGPCYRPSRPNALALALGRISETPGLA